MPAEFIRPSIAGQLFLGPWEVSTPSVAAVEEEATESLSIKCTRGLFGARLRAKKASNSSRVCPPDKHCEIARTCFFVIEVVHGVIHRGTEVCDATPADLRSVTKGSQHDLYAVATEEVYGARETSVHLD